MSGAVSERILLPGWSMEAATLLPLARGLNAPARVLDLPGQGERRNEAMPGSLDDLAQSLEQDLNDGVVLVGWSLGALAALAIVARGRIRPAALVLVNPTPRFLAGSDWEPGVDPALLERYEHAAQLDTVALRDEFTSLLLLGDGRRTTVLRQLQGLRRSVPAPAPAALAAGLKILRAADLRVACASIEIPALVVAGGGDRVTPPGAARWLATALPDATLVELGSAGHALPMSHAAELAAAITGFMAHRMLDAGRARA